MKEKPFDASFEFSAVPSQFALINCLLRKRGKVLENPKQEQQQPVGQQQANRPPNTKHQKEHINQSSSLSLSLACPETQKETKSSRSRPTKSAGHHQIFITINNKPGPGADSK